MHNFLHALMMLGPSIFGASGALVAGHVYLKKRFAKPLVCPLNGSCDTVTKSEYSRFLGVPVELMGVGYYTLIAIVYALKAFTMIHFSDQILFVLTGVTLAAFLFSAYLVSIQAFVLRKWCTWCLFSAGFSTLIALTSLMTVSFDLVGLLIAYTPLIVFVYSLASAVGVGAATLSVVLFVRSIKKCNLSPKEADFLSTIAMVVWGALATVVIATAGLAIPQEFSFFYSSALVLKMLAIGCIALAGWLITFYLQPRVIGAWYTTDSPRESLLHKSILVAGSVALVSWYTVFFLGPVQALPVRSNVAVVTYLTFLVVGAVVALLYEQYMSRQCKKQSESASLSVEQN